MSLESARKPRLWIIAGPNGSGKSTAYGMLKAEETVGSVWIINPDLLAGRIAEHDQIDLAEANRLAVERIEAWLYASVAAHQTVGVETVLSTSKYRRLVESAKANGFSVRMLFVYLDNPDLNVERVKVRVATGGHAVPEDKIRARWSRSFDNFAWFLREADTVDVFNNSGAEPRRVLTKNGNSLTIFDEPVPAMKQALDVAFGNDMQWVGPAD
ncbi:zeta toxin family protein [uncultured Brevundimonas sp.]|uniref:zeta toxin family protein n=1 Tax=uncultured Brevundimonas sp. TaxID=213418 RepID=UPI0025F7D5B3|nr:zeta toxin family protein [uncultured Brevundimonas sp.]